MRVRCIAGSLALIGIALASTAAAQTVRDVYGRGNLTVVVVYTAQRGLPAGQSGQLAMMGGLGSGVLIAPTRS